MERCFLGVLIISAFIFSAATSISGDILGSFPAKTNMIVRMDMEKLRMNFENVDSTVTVRISLSEATLNSKIEKKNL